MRARRTDTLNVTVSPVQRSKNRSAVGASAYQLREIQHQEPTRFTEERTYDYLKHTPDVIARGILAPEHAPGYLKNIDGDHRELMHEVSERLWNRAEMAGGRSNATTAWSWILPLPADLNRDQQRGLVEDFAKGHLVSRGMVVQYAIHEPHPSRANDRRNYHAHLLTTARDITPQGFAKKQTQSREWYDRTKHPYREAQVQWARYCNIALERAGLAKEVQIDNRPRVERLGTAMYRGDREKAKELAQAPQVHQGKNERELILRRQTSERTIARQQRSDRKWEKQVGKLRQVFLERDAALDKDIAAVEWKIVAAKGLQKFQERAQEPQRERAPSREQEHVEEPRKPDLEHQHEKDIDIRKTPPERKKEPDIEREL